MSSKIQRRIFQAFLLFLIPATRKNVYTRTLGAFMIYGGVYIEKGIALVIPGFTPSTLGDIYEYSPSRTEVMVAVGIYGVGFLLYTLMVKVAEPILRGAFHMDSRELPSRAGPVPNVQSA